MRQQVRRELQSHPSRLPNHSIPAFHISRRSLSSSQPQKAEEPSTEPKQPPPPSSPTNDNDDTFKTLASTIRQSPSLKQTTEPYIAYGTTSTLLAECSAQITYTIPTALSTPTHPAPQNASGQDVGEGTGWWYTPRAQGGLGLEVTFASWAQVMMLYLYCLTARLRAFPAQHARIWQQQLLDHFFYAAEDRMVVWHRLAARGVRNKYLKDLAQQWRGVLFSYDEGVIRGDAVLAAAVWRNVFKGDEGVDLEDLALVTAFLRGQLRMLDGLSDVEVGEGMVRFQDPGTFRAVVGRESGLMKAAFSNADKGATEARME